MEGIKAKVIFADGTDDTHKYQDLSPYKRVDFGLSLGGGANIPLKNSDKLNVVLRFAFGVTNVEKDASVSSSKNTTIQLSAVYLVDLTKWVNFNGRSAKNTETHDEGGVECQKVLTKLNSF